MKGAGTEGKGEEKKKGQAWRGRRLNVGVCTEGRGKEKERDRHGEEDS